MREIQRHTNFELALHILPLVDIGVEQRWCSTLHFRSLEHNCGCQTDVQERPPQ